MKEVLIIGAGPAGLTAAYELQKRSDEFHVTVLEEIGQVGGISRTVEWNGIRMDTGPHRFFSKLPEVNRWWEEMLPLQGSPSSDDLRLGREVRLSPGGPDPETADEVMLRRPRLSRILFDGKFYDYPISMKAETIQNMGLANFLRCGLSYLKTAVRKLPEDNLENFYINAFGKKLYSMFFEAYTENLWGRHPREIDASWGAQRTKGLSVSGILRDMTGKALHRKDRKVNTSLIEEFMYPKLGAGEMWEVAARKIRESGGDIVLNARVTGLEKQGSRIRSVRYEKDGEEKTCRPDLVISSMPVRDLVLGMNGVPEREQRIAVGLPYRSYKILGVLLRKLALENHAGNGTAGAPLRDSWIYVQDRTVRMGRLVLFNNWSPYLLKDPENTVLVGLEYFCTEGDAFWNQSEEDFVRQGIAEMLRIGLIRDASDVLDTHAVKIKKAYPAYFDTYSEMDTLVQYLDSIENLYCIGRNGQHRYNNMDHSMMTALEAVRCILSGSSDRSPIWKVNTEKEYHEEKRT